jgi:hypothetical protein
MVGRPLACLGPSVTMATSAASSSRCASVKPKNGLPILPPVEDELHVDRRGEPHRVHQFQRVEVAPDRPLVVRGSARVKQQAWQIVVGDTGELDGRCPRLGESAAEDGLDRVRLEPTLRRDGLNVVVAVDQHRARGPRDAALAKDGGVAASLQDAPLESASAQGGGQPLARRADLVRLLADGFRRGSRRTLDDGTAARNEQSVERGPVGHERRYPRPPPIGIAPDASGRPVVAIWGHERLFAVVGRRGVGIERLPRRGRCSRACCASQRRLRTPPWCCRAPGSACSGGRPAQPPRRGAAGLMGSSSHHAVADDEVHGIMRVRSVSCRELQPGALGSERFEPLASAPGRTGVRNSSARVPDLAGPLYPPGGASGQRESVVEAEVGGGRIAGRVW